MKFLSRLIILFLFANFIFTLDQKTRVILLGIDGLLQSCLGDTDISAIKDLQNDSSYTWKARTAIEAISGAGWSNILCGIDTEDSGIIDNDWMPLIITRKYSPITPVTKYGQLPCIFKELKDNNKQLKVKASHVWDFLLYFGNEHNPGVQDEERYCFPYDTLELTDNCDKKVKSDTLDFIRDDFDFIFTYFGSVDETGHITGFCSDRYKQQVSTVNGHIKEIIKELKDQNIYDSTTIILTTDHGANIGWKSHGYQNNDNLIIPWMVKGPGIKKNYEIKSTVKNLITPQVIAKAFGFKDNKFWRGKVPKEIYEKDDLSEMIEKYENELSNAQKSNLK